MEMPDPLTASLGDSVELPAQQFVKNRKQVLHPLDSQVSHPAVNVQMAGAVIHHNTPDALPAGKKSSVDRMDIKSSVYHHQVKLLRHQFFMKPEEFSHRL